MTLAKNILLLQTYTDIKDQMTVIPILVQSLDLPAMDSLV